MAIQLVAGATTSPDWREDQILVKPKSEARQALAQFHSDLGTKVLTTIGSIGGVQVVSVPPEETAASLIAKYQASGLVEYAEPDFLRQLAMTAPNDPKFLDGTLWALNNYGQNAGVAHCDLDATNAWDFGVSASNIVVAILDTGIRYTHEDLAANMWTNPNDAGHGWNAITGTNDPNDDNGHGTLMAGVVGGVGNNGKGITGVAWRVQLMGCKCFNSSGVASDTAILACLDYACTNGARIINASFDSTGFSISLSNSIFAARQAGIIFVASTGNNSTNIDVIPHYPACYDIANIVAVNYSGRDDSVGFFSNYGATNTDLFAPGDQIYSTFRNSDASYYPPTGLGINVSGTSFAAAYVSGGLALMLARYPALSYRQIIELLLASTDQVPGLTGKCKTGGRMNLRKALNRPWLSVTKDDPNGPAHVAVSAGTNRICVIETSTSVSSWTPVITNATSSLGVLQFDDSYATNGPARYYRALMAP